MTYSETHRCENYDHAHTHPGVRVPLHTTLGTKACSRATEPSRHTGRKGQKNTNNTTVWRNLHVTRAAIHNNEPDNNTDLKRSKRIPWGDSHIGDTHWPQLCSCNLGVYLTLPRRELPCAGAPYLSQNSPV